MARFRKKPVVIDAIQWIDGNLDEVSRFLGDSYIGALLGLGLDRISIKTLEGTISASPGDWVIRGIQGEHYPCKPDIFEATYERVEDNE